MTTTTALGIDSHWLPIKDGDPRAMSLFKRHYSFKPYRDHRPRFLFVGPGEKMVLLTVQCDAMFVWRKFIDDSGHKGVNCAVFRNEGPILSSILIREAVHHARQRWPGEAVYTYVNPGKIESTNPGYCFKSAGWHPCGSTSKGLVVLELPAMETDE